MNDDQLDDLLRDAAQGYNSPPDVPREAMWARIEAARAAAPPLALHASRGGRWRTAAGLAAVLLLGVAIGRLTRAPGGVATSPATRVASAPAATPLPAVPDTGSDTDTTVADGDHSSSSAGATAREVRSTATAHAAAGTRRLAAAPREPGGATTSYGMYGVPRHTPGAVGEGTEMNAYRLAVVEHLARTEVLLTGFRADASTGRQATREDARQFGVLSRELLQNTRLLLATHATDDPTLTRLLQDLELVLMQISQYASEGGARRGDLEAINQSLDRRNVLPKLRSTIPAGAPAPAGT